MPKTQKQKVGNLGENLACRFLAERGFKIVERNYRKKWGELDIVAEKNKKDPEWGFLIYSKITFSSILILAFLRVKSKKTAAISIWKSVSSEILWSKR